MPNHPEDCSRFNRWISEEPVEEDPKSWQNHLKNCPTCQTQWISHQYLLATFAYEPVPELSGDFNCRLESRLEAALQIRPLSGWRLAAILTYGAIAVSALGWLLRDSPLASLDPASPWLAMLAMALVPVTQAVALWASRLLPNRKLKGSLHSATSFLFSF